MPSRMRASVNCTSWLICFLATAALSGVPVSAWGQIEPGDLLLGVGGYPPFDAGTSYGAVRPLRSGSVLEPLDSYDTWSQGPHDLVNSIVVDGNRLLFDREEGVAILENGQRLQLQMSRKVSSVVRDRGGRIYVTSGYGVPVLEAFTSSGESRWMTTLPRISQAWGFAMDLDRDQCTLWYSTPRGPGIFVYDVCRRLDKRMVSASPAAAIRILAGGSALVALPTGIARIDKTGRVIAEVPYRLPRAANVEFVSLSVSADLATFWVAEGTQYGESLVYQRSLTDFALMTEYPVPREAGAVSSITIVPDWRAAAAPPVRRHSLRRE